MRAARKRGRRPDMGRAAFTFMEVLVALLVLVLLAGAVALSLTSAWRAEQLAGRQRNAQLILRELATRTYAGLDPTNSGNAGMASWQVRSEIVRNPDTTTDLAWRVWWIAPADEPSRSVGLALRETEP